MMANHPPASLVSQSLTAAADAASAAKVRVVDESELDRLLDVEALLIRVWGTSLRGAPVPIDILRSISHSGCTVTAAYDASNTLCGAAVAIVTPGASTYSLIAGVLAGAANAGVGFALKQHQRAWALSRDIGRIVWTFDPLVSRNARFNLTKLGAHALEYIPNFYGEMHDEINGNDESDRLVAVWPLASERAIASSVGDIESVELPPFTQSDVMAMGPDGAPMLVSIAGSLWCRVPSDIIALRGASPTEAAAWRRSVRQVFTSAFASTHSANGVTKSGWYRLTLGGPQ